MRILRSIAPALLALLPAPAAAGPIAALGEQENLSREELERQEIARILAADNVDPGRLTARQVAAAIRAIPRGEAPESFWNAYQDHVHAWERAADAEERLESLGTAKRHERERALAAYLETQGEISATFNRVRELADSYGVTMPIPPAEAANTI